MWTSICKKESSTTKHLIKEHHNESIDNNNRERSNSEDIPIEEVHTVNNWEDADLGDEQRKQKFLRLMGAKKRKDGQPEPQPEPSTTEKKHCRSKTETESINRSLEKQFNESVQSKILHTHHEGFGFHSETNGSADHKDRLIFVPASTTDDQRRYSH